MVRLLHEFPWLTCLVYRPPYVKEPGYDLVEEDDTFDDSV
jgi:hypothetical protein